MGRYITPPPQESHPPQNSPPPQKYPPQEFPPQEAPPPQESPPQGPTPLQEHPPPQESPSLKHWQQKNDLGPMSRGAVTHCLGMQPLNNSYYVSSPMQQLLSNSELKVTVHEVFKDKREKVCVLCLCL